MNLDHIVFGTFERDRVVNRIAEAVGLPVLDGYSVQGRVVARGVRFANGVFIDVHQALQLPAAETPVPRPLLGLSGPLAEAEALAAANDWRVSVQRRPEDLAVAAEPWSILSFRRRQGVLSSLFVIDYVAGAKPAENFFGPLYGAASRPERGPSLQRVWLAVADVRGDIAVLTALGFTPQGVVRSSEPPHAGWLLRGGIGDVVLHEACVEGVTRFDLTPGDRRGARSVELRPGLNMMIGS